LKFDLEHHPRERLTAIGLVILLVLFLYFQFSDASMLREDFFLRYQNTSGAVLMASGGAPLSATEKLEIAFDSFEQTLNEKIRYREQFIELHGLTQKLMGKSVIQDYNYGSLYKTKYGQVTFTINKVDVTPDLEGMTALKSELDELGLELLYIQAPFKLPEHEQQLPAHIQEYGNDNANRFLEGLEAKGIAYLDLRPEIINSGMTQNQLFYDTDHHWTIEAAFFSVGRIVGHLNRFYGFEIEDRVTDPAQFHFETHPEFFVGAMGRRVGRIYGGTDDFTVITPAFETRYTVTEKDLDPHRVLEGTFDEAVLVQSFLDEQAPLDTNRYAAYHGDHAELILTNHLVPNGRILMIKDSFGLPVYGFLSLGVHEVRALDVRLYAGSVAEYAKAWQPDLVVVLYNPNSLGSSMFEFSGH
jgi:hypothetical protein